MGNLLFLDVSTKTGWACLIDGKIEVGKEIFDTRRGESKGMRFLNFRNWMYRMCKMVNPRIIGYEQAHFRGAGTEFLVGLVTRVQEVAADRGIEYTGIHTGTLKKYITGHGKGDKQAIMGKMKELYPDIVKAHTDDDIADALAGLTWLRNEYGDRV